MRVERAFWFALFTGALVVSLALAFAFRDEHPIGLLRAWTLG